MATDIEKQLEIYRYKKYRKKRIRFYLLMTLAILLGAILIGLYTITNQPIDESKIENADSAIEVVQEEFGDTYINTLENLPTIGYESQYEALRSTYEDLLKEDGSIEDKNRIALDLVVFVEYVQKDSEKTANRYGLTGKSQRFIRANEKYKDRNGEVIDTLVKLTNHHSDTGEDLTEEELRLLLKDLDRRMSMYTHYLTSLKNTQ